MTQLTAAEISLAFNQQNTRATWEARPNSRPDSGIDVVHFTTASGLAAISYNTMDGRFTVRFNKYQAAWGDYIKTIAKSFYVILTTLKCAGLPFEAPDTWDGIEIVATSSLDSTVYVRWPGAIPPPPPNTLPGFPSLLITEPLN